MNSPTLTLDAADDEDPHNNDSDRKNAVLRASLHSVHDATFLTARPAFLRASTLVKLREAGLQHAALLTGDVTALVTNSTMVRVGECACLLARARVWSGRVHV